MALDKILVIGKDSQTHQNLRPFATQLFAADDISDVPQMIHSVEPQLIVFDPDVSRQQLCTFLETTAKNHTDIPIVVLGSDNDTDIDAKVIDLGAMEYIADRHQDRIAEIICDIENTDTDQKDDNFFAEECPPSVAMAGKSPAMVKSLQMMNIVAQSMCNPVLIVGETGTGKELAAKAVHVIRNGSSGKFVAINCAALTANLLESELFGHVKGSFTSADREKIGLLEIAGTGTVFLDEISEMPLDLQAKLLRILQEKTFRKVGGIKDIKCKATIIASSNRNLLKEAKKGKFRKDLYYRLSICPVTLAPLRAESRTEDISLLTEYFIKNSNICPEKTGQIKSLTKLAAQALEKHNWPGNVRELKNVIDRAIMLETTDKIGLSSLVIHPEHYDDIQQPAAPGIKDFSLETAEKELIAKALQEAGWQKTRAAAMLGITRATLYAKVKQYNIQQKIQQNVPAMTV